MKRKRAKRNPYYSLIYAFCKECCGTAKPRDCGGNELRDCTPCNLWPFAMGPTSVAGRWRRLKKPPSHHGPYQAIIRECRCCLGEPRDISICTSPKCAFYHVRQEEVDRVDRMGVSGMSQEVVAEDRSE